MYCDAGMVSSIDVDESKAPSGTTTDVPPSETVPPSASRMPDVLCVASEGQTARVACGGGGGKRWKSHDAVKSSSAAERQAANLFVNFGVLLMAVPSRVRPAFAVPCEWSFVAGSRRLGRA